ncbi:MAG: ABC transporter substrate-binding protein [Intrasporangium sp.]|uniref:ABC transporter substrate-binding protein n=1 Tax=Intrasporangium sp. TaxID=1925024 RepID=UPI002648E339|nr:ABC transporter substrate-binding protein [Intrasporangium sp.]MDN5795043.1 ABC transporter substrate-binding protein [Intrasporangium sp.]
MPRRPTVLAALVVAVVMVTGAVGALAGCTQSGAVTSHLASTALGPTALGPTASEPVRPEGAHPEGARPQGARPQRPLVVETVLGEVDLDPSRQLGRTDVLVAKALYQTLTTLSGTDETQAVPGLAQYTISPEGRWLTLRLRAGATFSDGAPVTTDDVAFTLRRAQGLGGPPSRVLGTVTMTKVDDRTLTISSPDANFALPAILANPAFGILNSSVVKARGGTIGPHDEAGRWLQTHSAGSGPYVLASRTADSITLTANPHWPGPRPAHPDIVIHNASPAQQRRDLEARRADVVLDLSPRQAEAVRQDPEGAALHVMPRRSSTLAYLVLNASSRVGRWTADPDVVAAVRSGLDRAALAALFPGGAIPAQSLVAQGIVGALEADPTLTSASGTAPASAATTYPSTPTEATSAADAAKTALNRAGYHGQPLTLVYAEDRPIAGIPSRRLAEAVAGQLAKVGLRVDPKGEPAAGVAAAYRAGSPPFALRAFTPAYPEPGAYLAFAPGGPIGLRAGWRLQADSLVGGLTVEAMDSVGAEREAAYQAWQRAMNAAGPFVPLIQPIRHLAHGDRVRTLPTNPIWTIDLAAIR